MRRLAAGCLGIVLGALGGAALGVGAGFLWTWADETSCFEGYCAMLVFFTFMPVGAIVGALIGPFASVWLVRSAPGGGDRTGGAAPS